MDCRLKVNKGKPVCRKGITSKIKNTPNDTVIIPFMVVTGILMYLSNIWRASVGWFENGVIIFWNTFFYIIFFGLITGYVVAKILGRGV